MKLMNPSSIIFLLMLILLGSCKYEKKEPPMIPVAQNVCDTSAVTYGTIIKPFVSTYCANNQACHVHQCSGPGNFNNYAELKQKINDGLVQDRVFNKKDMPPSYAKQPGSCELQQLKKWIDTGSPQN